MLAGSDIVRDDSSIQQIIQVKVQCRLITFRFDFHYTIYFGRFAGALPRVILALLGISRGIGNTASRPSPDPTPTNLNRPGKLRSRPLLKRNDGELGPIRAIYM
jgi:hypothetical protein